MIPAGIIGTNNKPASITLSINSIPDLFLTGYYSENTGPDFHHRTDLPVKRFNDPNRLIQISDAIIFNDHPGEYRDLIHHVLKNSKHVLIFTDITLSISHLHSLIKLADEAGVLLFLYHREMNTQMQEIILNHIGRPEFIDNYICLDQSSADRRKNIFEALYRELFVLMKINPVNARKYFINAIPYFSSDPHFVNVRIEFENGASANVTINKYSGQNKSRLEIFRYDKKALINHETGEILISVKNKDMVHYPGKRKHDSSREGLEIFINYLKTGNSSADPFETGILAHKIAMEIIQQLIPVPEKSLL
jgi:hypothetical protein